MYQLSTYLYVIFHILFTTSFVSCSFKDPGVMKSSQTKIGDFESVASVDETTTSQDNSEYKFCETCMVMPIADSMHCYDCGWCVENYDHHCSVVGNCIAKNNLRNFI
jgi:hypothetical protein